jgi:hypothetical protein
VAGVPPPRRAMAAAPHNRVRVPVGDSSHARLEEVRGGGGPTMSGGAVRRWGRRLDREWQAVVRGPVGLRCPRLDRRGTHGGPQAWSRLRAILLT